MKPDLDMVQLIWYETLPYKVQLVYVGHRIAWHVQVHTFIVQTIYYW